MEIFNYNEGNDIKLSSKEEKFEQYEALQVELLTEDDKDRISEIEKQLNELAEALNIEDIK